MGFKVACVLISVFMIQTITSQCLRGPFPYANEIATAKLAAEVPLAYPVPPLAETLACPVNPMVASTLAYEAALGPGVPGLNYGLSLADLSASNGPGLRVNSASPMAATGVKVETDKMLIEGPLAVQGQLPFLGVVALEGPLPASGTGAVAYECGDGNVGIVKEGIEPAPLLAPAYPNGAYPNGPLAPAYPNGPLAPTYPYGPAAGYPNMLAPGYPNMLAPGYPNAGVVPFANGCGQIPQAVV